MKFDAKEAERLAGDIGALHAKRGRRVSDPRVLSRRRERGLPYPAGAGL